MLLASIRLGILITTLVASVNAAAAPRFWTLTGVTFEDGAVATGYFSHDNATGTVESWNVRVSGGAGTFVPHTFFPGNSTAGKIESYFGFSSPDPRVNDRCCNRILWIIPLAPLEGSSAAVSLGVSGFSGSYESFEDNDGHEREIRSITKGSLVLTPFVILQVDEFYHPGLRQYFITANEGEKRDLDTGRHRGWMRTGESFKVYATGSTVSDSINPVCRYHGNTQRGLNSHFYSADPDECLKVFRTFRFDWLWESDNVFQVNLPDITTGACPAGTIPVYRLWNQRADSGHRYTTRAAIKAEMLAAGYRAEGYGADGVAMCAVQ